MAQQTGYYDASKYNTGFFSNILGNIGGLNLGDLAQTGLSYAALRDEFGRTSDIAQQAAEGARQIGQEAAAASQFRPFTVTTGFGGVEATPEGGFATALSPQQQARQEALSGITGGLLGGFTGAGAPDVSGIQEQALGGVTGALTAAQAPMATREADVFERIRAHSVLKKKDNVSTTRAATGTGTYRITYSTVWWFSRAVCTSTGSRGSKEQSSLSSTTASRCGKTTRPSGCTGHVWFRSASCWITPLCYKLHN